MAKQMTFGDKDAELVKRIAEFQKAQELPTFIAAVRALCESGLGISHVVKRLK